MRRVTTVATFLGIHISIYIEKLRRAERGLIKLSLYEEYTCGYVATVATFI